MTVKDNSYSHGLRKFAKRQLAKRHPLDVAVVRELVNNLEVGYNNSAQPRVNFMLQNPITVPRRLFATATWAAMAFSGSGTFGVGQQLGTFGPWPATILKDGTVAPIHIQCACSTGGQSISASSNTTTPRNYLFFEYIPTSAPSIFPATSGDSLGRITLTHTGSDLTSSWKNLDAAFNPNSLIVYDGFPALAHDAIKLNDAGAPTHNDYISMKLNVWTLAPNAGDNSNPPVSWVIPENLADKTISFQGLIVRETTYSEDNF